MKLFASLVVVLTAMASSAGAALAHDYTLGSLSIMQPWARATPKGAETAAAYLAVKNNGTTPDRLVSVTLSDVAATAQIHEMSMDNGVMKMREIPDGLEIKPGDTVTLQPSGFHVMLMGLKAPLKKGQTVSGTLTFEKAGTINVEFEVAPVGSSGPAGASHMQHDHMQMDHMN
jgi:periplasmic copper chaperone A